MKALKDMKTVKAIKAMKKKKAMTAKANKAAGLIGRRVAIVATTCAESWQGTVLAVRGNLYEIDLDKAWHRERGGAWFKRQDFRLLPK
jgi:hypothetical protein